MPNPADKQKKKQNTQEEKDKGKAGGVLFGLVSFFFCVVVGFLSLYLVYACH
jgi:hypothetical protein